MAIFFLLLTIYSYQGAQMLDQGLGYGDIKSVPVLIAAGWRNRAHFLTDVTLGEIQPAADSAPEYKP